MKREVLAFTAAGIVFGFVLGFMVAQAGRGPASGPLPASAAPHEAAPTAARTPDPDEVRALESLAARDKQNTAARIELGNLYMDAEQYEPAIRWYGEALVLKPDATNVITDLGACLVGLGRTAEAIERFDRALKLDPKHRKAAFNKGVALMNGGQGEKAIAVWEDLLARFPNDPELEGLKERVAAAKARLTGSSQ
jgi:tetratricopeptide (TPR) repeat protein